MVDGVFGERVDHGERGMVRQEKLFLTKNTLPLCCPARPRGFRRSIRQRSMSATWATPC
jgi:hypothetical protein